MSFFGVWILGREKKDESMKDERLTNCLFFGNLFFDFLKCKKRFN